MDRFREDLLESQTVFSGRLLQVRVDRVRLGDGTEATREIVVHPGAVAAVPLLDNDVLLVRQWRQPLGRETIEIPAGTLRSGEAPEDCVVRELQEEIGFRPGRLELLLSVALAPGYSSEIIHIYLAEELEPAEAGGDFDERVGVVRMPFNQAVRMCLDGELADAKTAVGILTVAIRSGRTPADWGRD
ncbi:MAG: NUDIX hydrolase [Armatimonadetes bacterium]|nr:NUDIX hydrolase [Armatimonadota bacterium]